jgi:hypothetical protein
MKLQFKLQPVLIALTVANFALLIFLLGQARAVAAPADDGILRGKGLQITDNTGKVRASISIMPASRLNDGSTYPETVLLRLITDEGRPSVKISAMTDGSGMALSDGQGLSYVQVLARGDKPEFNIVDKTGAKVKSLP